MDDLGAVAEMLSAGMSPQQEVLRGPFDPKRHREAFKHHLEVVVLEDGTVEYAVPSHQEKLKQVYRERFQSDPDEDCPPEMYWDYLGWLEECTGAISVWTNMYSAPRNARQKQALVMLAAEGLLEVTRNG